MPSTAFRWIHFVHPSRILGCAASEHEFDEAEVQKGNACFDGHCHRVSIFVSQQCGQGTADYPTGKEFVHRFCCGEIAFVHSGRTATAACPDSGVMMRVCRIATTGFAGRRKDIAQQPRRMTLNTGMSASIRIAPALPKCDVQPDTQHASHWGSCRSRQAFADKRRWVISRQNLVGKLAIEQNFCVIISAEAHHTPLCEYA